MKLTGGLAPGAGSALRRVVRRFGTLDVDVAAVGEDVTAQDVVHRTVELARQHVPAVSMRVQHQSRALAQKAHAAEADRVDIDDGAVAAGCSDDVVVTHHLVGVGM